jgi:hypothetical protein
LRCAAAPLREYFWWSLGFELGAHTIVVRRYVSPENTAEEQAVNVAKPHRVSRTYTQRLVAEPARVFPLLCPVREADWIEGWDPLEVFSESGVAERDCVFVTPASPNNAVWYITRHEAPSFVEMLKITPEVTACKLTIELRAVNSGSEAIVTYMHTSLGPRGDAFVASFTEEHYTSFMQDWERRLNHFLAHGTLHKKEADSG